jgi:hypothetical protein
MLNIRALVKSMTDITQILKKTPFIFYIITINLILKI